MSVNPMVLLLLLFLITPTGANIYHSNRSLLLSKTANEKQQMNIYDTEYIPKGEMSHISFQFMIEAPQNKSDDFHTYFYVVAKNVSTDQNILLCTPDNKDQYTARGLVIDDKLLITGDYQTAVASQDQLSLVYLCAHTHDLMLAADNQFTTPNAFLMVESEVTFHHPHGYLNFIKFYYLRFLRVLIAAYLVLLASWILALRKWNEDVTKYHRVATALIVTTMMVSLVQWIYLEHYNSTGMPYSNKYELFHNILNSFQQGFFRYFLLILSSGWGMAKENINNLYQYHILVGLFVLVNFGATYFDSSYGQGYPKPMHSKINMIFILATGGLESIIGVLVLWNFEAIMTQLKETQQVQKIKFYEHMMLAFGLVGSLMVCMVVATTIYVYNDSYQRAHYSQSWFFLGGSSKIVYFIGIVAFCAVFHPNKKTSLYMQSNQLPINDGFSMDESFHVHENEDEVFGTSTEIKPTFTV